MSNCTCENPKKYWIGTYYKCRTCNKQISNNTVLTVNDIVGLSEDDEDILIYERRMRGR